MMDQVRTARKVIIIIFFFFFFFFIDFFLFLINAGVRASPILAASQLFR